MKCWHCGANQEDFKEGRLSFRAECERCHHWLHCCQNCQFYQPGRSNDCKVPGTDAIKDKSAMNFCEDFKQLGMGPKKTQDSAKSKFDALFKED